MKLTFYHMIIELNDCSGKGTLISLIRTRVLYEYDTRKTQIQPNTCNYYPPLPLEHAIGVFYYWISRRINTFCSYTYIITL